jgi:hypothetical protein
MQDEFRPAFQQFPGTTIQLRLSIIAAGWKTGKSILRLYGTFRRSKGETL